MTAAAGWALHRLDARPPGLYVEHRERSEQPAPGWSSGIPVFIGFARADRSPGENGRVGATFKQWDAATFEDLVAPAPRSFLAPVVRGFFANGGSECVVLAIPLPTDRGDPAAALLQLLQPGGLLDDRSDVDLVCVPDAALACPQDGTGGDAWHDIASAALAHCERMGDRFAIIDAPRAPGAEGEEPAVAIRRAAGSLRSACGALYVPWVVTDPAREGSQPMSATGAYGAAEQWRCRAGVVPSGVSATVPPCGHIAGIYARLDRLIGVQRAPANETMEGVLDTSLPLDAAQRGMLNDAGVNALHAPRGRGVLVGGARTLSGHAHWAHVSTVRVILDFRRWVAHGLRDLVFEPQSTGLWDLIRVRLVSRCMEMQRRGALVGDASSPGFFVKCDAETNPPDERELGRVVAHVGLAPTVPAEFILIRVVHDASGFTVSGLS